MWVEFASENFEQLPCLCCGAKRHHGSVRDPIFSTFRVAVRRPSDFCVSTRARRCRAKKISDLVSLSLSRTLHQTNHAAMLPRLLLFYSASLLLLAGLDVRHQQQGAKSTVACVLSPCLDNHRGTLRQWAHRQHVYHVCCGELLMREESPTGPFSESAYAPDFMKDVLSFRP